MKDVLKTIIESLVEEKEAIQINQKEDGKGIVFEVKVSEKDMGRIIGREGRIARAIRTIFKSIATREQKKITIEFIDK